MKDNANFETPFEKSLADFEKAPLPADWKAGLIENAVSQPIVRFPSFPKIAVGALAACWVAIGVLHATTPVDPNFQTPAFSQKTKLSPEDLTILAHYFETRKSLHSQF